MPSVIFGIVLLAVVLTVAVAAMRDARLAEPFENRRAIKSTASSALPCNYCIDRGGRRPCIARPDDWATDC